MRGFRPSPIIARRSGLSGTSSATSAPLSVMMTGPPFAARHDGAPPPEEELREVPEAVPAGDSTPLQWSLRLDDLAPAGYTAELFYP